MEGRQTAALTSHPRQPLIESGYSRKEVPVRWGRRAERRCARCPSATHSPPRVAPANRSTAGPTVNVGERGRGCGTGNKTHAHTLLGSRGEEAAEGGGEEGSVMAGERHGVDKIYFLWLGFKKRTDAKKGGENRRPLEGRGDAPWCGKDCRDDPCPWCAWEQLRDLVRFMPRKKTKKTQGLEYGCSQL